MNQNGSFAAEFRALTGNDPFPWQEKLYHEFFSKGNFPPCCAIPTGLGKTSVMAIWLIALANHPDLVPRRLVYVVNRRTVVDQSTDEATRMRERLLGPQSAGDDGLANTLRRLAESLRRLSGLGDDPADPPLAISTLRGQFADNGEWCANPARPAVIAGTVDMIGSRLLFSGYRIGFKSRPLHAGFLGQDSLVVHDEAHLEPAFQELLLAIYNEQTLGRTPDWRPMKVMELSATSRGSVEPFELTQDERNPPPVVPASPARPVEVAWRRLAATKSLMLISVREEKQVVPKTIELALAHRDSGDAVLVFARTVEAVEAIQKGLVGKGKAAADAIQILTGTMRGRERDQLANGDPVFARFYRKSKAEPKQGTVYLICTSAGEVGVDLSADHLVCDLTPLDSMAQRFGRVNRFGDREDTRIEVVHVSEPGAGEKGPAAEILKRTLAVLESLNGDASPLALAKIDPSARQAAFSEAPATLPTTDVLFDAWALTTIRDRMPGRPPVDAYLHGIAEWEPPETHVAWREEVELVTEDLFGRHSPADLLEDYPLKPHELLRDRSERVFAHLQLIAQHHPGSPVWVVDDQGEVAPALLGRLADPQAAQAAAKRPLIARIEGKTLLLPPGVGGLSRSGMLDGTSDYASDVADVPSPAAEERIRLFSNDAEYDARTAGLRQVRSIELDGSGDGDDERPTWDWYKAKPLEGTRTAQKPVRWEVHVADVEREIGRIFAGLRLPDDLAQAIRVAVRLHDHGKRRPQFQWMLGNHDCPRLLLAKSGGSGAKLPETFRHEFASLADALADPEFQQLAPVMQDVVLHLIAAHHGRARPHFRIEEAYDPAPERPQAELDRLACDVPRRFALLQRQYGRWGLAYLESLLRAADWAASAKPSAYLEALS